MFHTGLDPFTMQPVYVPRSYEEKRRQRALLQSARPENYDIVRRALEQAGPYRPHRLRPRMPHQACQNAAAAGEVRCADGFTAREGTRFKVRAPRRESHSAGEGEKGKEAASLTKTQ